MNDNYEPVPVLSTATARKLWIIAVTVCGFSLALNLWGCARIGLDWTTLSGPLGALMLVASYPLIRSRGRLYLVLQVVVIGLFMTRLILFLRQV